MGVLVRSGGVVSMAEETWDRPKGRGAERKADDPWTIQEAAKELRLSYKSTLRRCQSGKLPAHYHEGIGGGRGTWRIPAEALADYKARTLKGPAATEAA